MASGRAWEYHAARAGAGSIFLIVFPIHRVGLDVAANAIPARLVADDVFIIVALPQTTGERRPTDLADRYHVGAGYGDLNAPDPPPNARPVGAGLVPARYPGRSGFPGGHKGRPYVRRRMMIPWKWFGMTIESPVSIPAKPIAEGTATCHRTISPAAFTRISPSTIGTKQRHATMRHDGDEICAGGGIIEFLKAHGTAMGRCWDPQTDFPSIYPVEQCLPKIAAPLCRDDLR